jgi:2'-5' RNA ligase
MASSDMMPGEAIGQPLILTADMEPRAFEQFEALRRRHFPPARNLVPAHLTLFHHLPGPERADIAQRLRAETAGAEPPVVRVSGVRFLGRGVAFALQSPPLEALRDDLAQAWFGLLVPQDRAGFRPHVTVQNKVAPEVARTLARELEAGFRPWSFKVPALRLWRYLGGPWGPVARFPFRGASLS